MGDYVNDALLNASPYKKQQDESKHLVNKWEKTGLLAVSYTHLTLPTIYSV